MKRLNRLNLAVSLALSVLLAFPLVYAQQGAGPGQQARMYNPATEKTAKGSAEEIKAMTGRHGWNGTHLTLKTEDKTINVHLGPSSFLKEKGFNLEKGDRIEVNGSTIEVGGSQALIAREVKKDDKTLVLRDAQGTPKWSGGWRR